MGEILRIIEAYEAEEVRVEQCGGPVECLWQRLSSCPLISALAPVQDAVRQRLGALAYRGERPAEQPLSPSVLERAALPAWGALAAEGPALRACGQRAPPGCTCVASPGGSPHAESARVLRFTR